MKLKSKRFILWIYYNKKKSTLPNHTNKNYGKVILKREKSLLYVQSYFKKLFAPYSSRFLMQKRSWKKCSPLFHSSTARNTLESMYFSRHSKHLKQSKHSKQCKYLTLEKSTSYEANLKQSSLLYITSHVENWYGKHCDVLLLCK